MVRFIMISLFGQFKANKEFTFQYGQIYYRAMATWQTQTFMIYIPIWLDLLFIFFNYTYQSKIDLHSNMVRFIIFLAPNTVLVIKLFTFQYGQIYYAFELDENGAFKNIYIPIWLDLLLNNLSSLFNFLYLFTFQYGQIYY